MSNKNSDTIVPLSNVISSEPISCIPLIRNVINAFASKRFAAMISACALRISGSLTILLRKNLMLSSSVSGEKLQHSDRKTHIGFSVMRGYILAVSDFFFVLMEVFIRFQEHLFIRKRRFPSEFLFDF